MRTRNDCARGLHRWRGLCVLTSFALILLLERSAFAVPVDHSLRIGTYNSWMLGDGAVVPGFACDKWNDSCHYETPINGVPYCICGEHPMFPESADRVAGAHALATRIKNSGFDVIAIEEVWDSGLQNVLQQDLSATYPNYVKFTHYQGSAIDETEDSGLMIFAKADFPFQPINAGYQTGCGNWVGTCDWVKPINSGCNTCTEVHMVRAGVVEPTPENFMAFSHFNNALYDDARSYKGVAYVRVKNAGTNRISNIFFTHMQASYASEFGVSQLALVPSVFARQDQMARIFDLYNNGRSQVHPNANAILDDREDVFFMGDVNIDGDQSNTYQLYGNPPYNNLAEWTHYFNDSATLTGGFSTKLWDVWANESFLRNTILTGTKDDFGLTQRNLDCNDDINGDVWGWSVLGCRWDVLTHNTPLLSGASKLCNQHTSLAYNLFSNAATVANESAMSPGARNGTADGKAGLALSDVFHSDHMGVQSDYNRMAPQCSPLLQNIDAPTTSQAYLVYGSDGYGAHVLTNAEVGNDANGQPSPSTGGGTLFTGNIANPGNVQWYYVPATMKGTYLMGFQEDGTVSYKNLGFVVQVFKPEEMSIAYKDYKNEWFNNNKMTLPGGGSKNIFGKKWVLDDPPYYVKVFNSSSHSSGNCVGSYVFGVHRCACTDKTGEACVILPNSSVLNAPTYQFPASILASTPTPDSFYFQFDVQGVTVPGNQTIQTVVSGYSTDILETEITTPATTVDVYNTDTSGDRKVNAGYNNRVPADVATGSSGYGTTCPQTAYTLGEGPDFNYCNNVITWSHPQPTTGTAPHFLRVRRKSGTSQQQFKAHWRTNLMVMRGSDQDIHLKAHTLTDDVSVHDEIDLEIDVDGADTTPMVVNHSVSAGDDMGLAGKLEAIYPLGLRSIGAPYVSIFEVDDGEDETWTTVGPAISFQCKGPATTCFTSGLKVDFSPSSFDGGFYTFWYALSHGTQIWETYKAPKAVLLSQNKPATQSPTYSTWVASRAVDGSTNYAASGNSVAATEYLAFPWWYVDLGATKTLESVWIYTCTSGCAVGSTSNFYVDYYNGTWHQAVQFAGSAGSPTVIDLGNVTGSRVRIRKADTNFLDLAEVQVYGY